MLNKISTVVFALFIVTVFAYANMAKAQIVEDGLISYWTFDNEDIDGNTVKDLRGNNHGTIEGNPETVEGHISEALEFHGQPDRVVVSNNESLALSDEFTVEAWAKVTKYVANAAIVTKGTNSGFFALEVIAPKGFKVRLNSGGDGDSHGQYTGLFEEDRWYHLTMIVDGRGDAGLKLYVDGVVMPTQDNLAVGNIVCKNDLYIGYEQRNNSWFVGVIDEVRIYDRALNEGEIQANFASKGFTAVAPVAKLTFTWGAIKALR